jgi:hypothetical protein
MHSLANLFVEAAKVAHEQGAQQEEGSSNLARDIVVAKLDGTKNDIDYEGVHIRGFPTILMFR